MSKRIIGVQFSEDQIARLDRVVRVLRRRSPGTRVTRSDVIREAVKRGFIVLEEERYA